MSVTLTPREFADELKRLGNGAYVQAAIRGLHSAALRSVAVLQERTRRAPSASGGGKSSGGAVDRGGFLRSWGWEAKSDGASVANSAPYAPMIEEGRRPGKFPPLDVIRRWASRRLGLSGPEAARAAFAIARAIARRGLRARKILERALPELSKLIDEEVGREMERALREGR
jgi:hypothetical protein